MAYESGDTIRAVATFRDWAPEGQTGNIADPTGVVVTVYNADMAKINTYTYGTDNEVGQESAGIYYFDFTIPDADTYYIEFNGDLDGKPTVERTRVKSKFDVK